jgi:hypothetical protein
MRGLVGAILLFSGAAFGDASVAERPKVVTKAWLRETLQKKGALAKLIDDGAGLVVIKHLVDSGKDNDPGIVSAERLCGAALQKRWPKLEADARDYLRRSEDESFSCQNRPGPPLCSFGVMFEYSSNTYVLFRADADGRLYLDAILGLDQLSNVVGSDGRRAQIDYVRAQLTKLRSTDCAGKSASPSEEYKRFRSTTFELDH